MRKREFYNKEFKVCILNQIERTGLNDKIHFLPFITDPGEYKILLSKANTFWGLCREEHFSSTVLEAMDSQLSVIGFKWIGGAEIMLSDGRGILVETYDLSDIVKNIHALLENAGMSEEMCKKAKAYVNQMDFLSYTKFLQEQFIVG